MVQQNLAKWLDIWLYMDDILVWCEVHALPATKELRAQYYPISKKDKNDDCPDVKILPLPIQTLEGYWETIERIEATRGNNAQSKVIVWETGSLVFPFVQPAQPSHTHTFSHLTPFICSMKTACHISEIYGPHIAFHQKWSI